MISPSLEYLEKAWDDAKYGRFSEGPMIDAVIDQGPDHSPRGPSHNDLLRAVRPVRA